MYLKTLSQSAPLQSRRSSSPAVRSTSNQPALHTCVPSTWGPASRRSQPDCRALCQTFRRCFSDWFPGFHAAWSRPACPSFFSASSLPAPFLHKWAIWQWTTLSSNWSFLSHFPPFLGCFWTQFTLPVISWRKKLHMTPVLRSITVWQYSKIPESDTPSVTRLTLVAWNLLVGKHVSKVNVRWCVTPSSSWTESESALAPPPPTQVVI